MKKLFSIFIALTIISFTANSQLIKKLGDKVKTKTAQRADQKVDNAIDKGLDKTEEAAKKKDDNTASSNTTTTSNGSPKTTETAGSVTSDTPVATPAAFKVYQNYDFVPGNKILFEDNFINDQDGEFPAHWELAAGQAVINKVNGVPAMHMIEGNYARVFPRMKVDKYLTDTFTIEYDYYFIPGAYGLLTMFKYYDKELGFERESYVSVNSSETGFSGNSNSFTKALPEEISGEAFYNKWHHVAIAYKAQQLKVYVDQFRVLVVPDTKEKYHSIQFAGIGDEKNPMVFTNARIASGGGMNMIGKKFTDAKIVTHGINFDVNKAIIKPESMGTLNGIVKILADNPEIKFEVGGHTDSDGDDAANLKLSQARADAVRTQLVAMGVDGARLTTKGYGETKPIADNTTLEGKANNRRVEFVKK